MSPFPSPKLDTETGEPATRRQTCYRCSTDFQQTAVETEGVSTQGAVVDKRVVWIPSCCAKCSREAIHVAANQPPPPLTMEPE